MHRMDAFGQRLITRRRVYGYAIIVTAVVTAFYGYGLARGKGLIDGFGHVVGGDLLTWRVAGALVRDGQGSRLYDFALQSTYQQRAVAPGHLPGLIPFTMPPFVALVFWPWSFLPAGLAFALWSALSLALLALAVRLGMASQGFDRSAWLFGIISALSFFPVLEGLMAGNSSAVSLFLFTLIFLALKRRQDGLAGALLGFELIKPQLVPALLVVLIWKRRWRAVLGFGAVAAGWGILSVAFVDWQSPIAFLHTLPLLTRPAFVPGFPTELPSSIYALLLVPLGPARFGIAMTLGSVAAASLVVALLRAWSGGWRPESAEFDLRFAFTLVITCLPPQYLELHDCTILILAAILLAGSRVKTEDSDGRGTLRVVFAVVWVTCWIGPLLTPIIWIPLVPLALLMLGGTIWLLFPRHAPTEAESTPSGARPASARRVPQL